MNRLLHIGALGLIGLATGCADGRTAKPFSVAMPGNAGKLASCTYRATSASPGALDIRLTKLDDIGATEVTADLPTCFVGCGTPRRIWQLRFTHSGEHTTNIEVSDNPTIQGNHLYWHRDIEPKLVQCARDLSGG